MTLLEEHTLKFWTAMRKLKGPILSQTFARENELPTLATTTPFTKISNRITKELSNVQHVQNQ